MKARFGLLCLVLMAVPTAAAETVDTPAIGLPDLPWFYGIHTQYSTWNTYVAADVGPDEASACAETSTLPDWVDPAIAALMGLGPKEECRPAPEPVAYEAWNYCYEEHYCRYYCFDGYDHYCSYPAEERSQPPEDPLVGVTVGDDKIGDAAMLAAPIVNGAQEEAAVAIVGLQQVQVTLPTLDLPALPSVDLPALGDGQAPVAAIAPEAKPSASVATQSSKVSIFKMPLVIAAVATVLVASVGAAAGVAFVPGWRNAAWKAMKKLGLIGLFSRLAQADVLNHSRRNEILEFVRNNPGERVEQTRRVLGLPNGSMHYHLRVLQDRDLVRVHRDGGVARLFLAGPRIQPAPYVPDQRKRLLELVQNQPGLTQRELATAMALSERMASYHVRTLTQQGLLEVRPEGARNRLFVRPLVSA